ncbi:MAG: helix-turn-helix transcriptional regulator, partial [Gammaproteobacteria bacterium]
MQEIKSNSTDIEGPPKKTVSIGALLVNARKNAALNQTDIAEQINLSKHIIEALEVDDYDNLPEPTYIRGYLRN